MPQQNRHNQPDSSVRHFGPAVQPKSPKVLRNRRGSDSSSGVSSTTSSREGSLNTEFEELGTSDSGCCSGNDGAHKVKASSMLDWGAFVVSSMVLALQTRIVQLACSLRRQGGGHWLLRPEPVVAASNNNSSEDCDGLTRSMLATAAESERQQQQKSSVPSSGGWRLCPGLRYYRQQQSDRAGRSATQPAVLRFDSAPFDAAKHAPARLLAAGSPPELADMHREASRFASFGDSPSVDSALARRFAAAGWFCADDSPAAADGVSLRCAFCLGRATGDAEAREDPWRLHRENFSTCPMLLGVDVANKPMPPQPDDLRLSAPTACSSGDADVYDWRPAEAEAATESEASRQLRLRPSLPVSSETARAACDPDAERNLRMLASSCGQEAAAAARYHPMRWPGMADVDAREASLRAAAAFSNASLQLSTSSSSGTPASQLLPPDYLASAGFFAAVDAADDADADTDGAVVCYWCGISVGHWLVGDDPWIEHARWSPRCCHLLMRLGADVVLAARRDHPPYQPVGTSTAIGVVPSRRAPASRPLDVDHRPKASSSSSSSSRSSSALVDFRVEPRHLRAREDFPTTALARRLLGDVGGVDDLRTATAQWLRGVGDDFASSAMLLCAGFEVRRQRRLLNLGAAEFLEQRNRELESRRSVEAPAFDGDELDWRVCKVCMDRLINVTLIDCHHFCCCSNCARSLDSCPLCRAPIRATLLVAGEDC